ncbi:MAG: WD40/YVTN/BNR-like repeat-containing protein [Limisphaerales bacterium]
MRFSNAFSTLVSTVRRSFGGGVFLLATATLLAGLPAPWRYVTPLPQGNDLLAAWAAGPDDFYAGGHGGVILHWDGESWTPMPTPTQKTVFAIHGLSPTNIWAVGGDAYAASMTNRSLILHYDGKAWKEVASPDFLGTTYPLNCVYAVAPDDVWATTDGGTWPIRWNGQKWDFHTDLNGVDVEGTFKTIVGIGREHLFLAGSHGQIIHRFNNQWTLERKTQSGGFTTDLLVTLWAHDLDTVYAGGTWGHVVRRQADGTWSEVLGGGLFEGPGMVKIWGRSPTDVFVQGPDSIRHFDGATVTTNSYSRRIRGNWVAGAGAGDRIYGVGPDGVAHEFVPGNGGGVLSALTAGGESQIGIFLQGATPCGPEGILLYGSSLYRPDPSPLIHFDGALLKPLTNLPPNMQRESHVGAALANGPDDLILAWDNQTTFGRGVHHWQGGQWQSMGPLWNQPAEAIAFWRSPTGKLFACGPGRIMIWNGQDDWDPSFTVPVEEMATTVLRALWGRSDNEVYVGTQEGRILRFDGQQWKEETTPATRGAINTIAGSGTEIYAAGNDALLWRRTPSGWQQLGGFSAREGDHFTRLVAKGNAVYASQLTPPQYIGGGLAQLWRLEGTQATLEVKGLSRLLYAFAATPEGHLYGFSTASTILTDKPVLDAPALIRVDLAKTDWQAAGSSGLQLRSTSPQGARPVIAVQRLASASAGVDASWAEGVTWGREHWVIREDVFNAGAALPPMYVRFQYDPARLPEGFDPANARLYRFHQGAWTLVPATVDPIGHWIASNEPTGLSEWTFGSMPAAELPTAKIRLGNAGDVILSWPESATGFRLEASPTLHPPAWETVETTPSVSGGFREASLPTTAPTRFYRLTK